MKGRGGIRTLGLGKEGISGFYWGPGRKIFGGKGGWVVSGESACALGDKEGDLFSLGRWEGKKQKKSNKKNCRLHSPEKGKFPKVVMT